MIKILFYFTILIPVSFAALCISASERQKTEQTIGFKEMGLAEVFSTYNPAFLPQMNRANLEEYSHSDEYRLHAKSAKIYYNSQQLSPADAERVIFQREPTNIAMGQNQYNKVKLSQLFGYERSVYNDESARKQDGSQFSDLPNTAAVYSETYLWDPPGGNKKKEVACLSLPAPALDSSKQPHYSYYVGVRGLDQHKYENEMAFLFKCIEMALRDHHEIAFGNKGIQRLVLSRFGQGEFLKALTPSDRAIAQQAYRSELAKFLSEIRGLDVEVVMSEYQHPGADIWHSEMIIGDIVQTAREGDLIINAWDPHSAPGNGNDADRSFDGAMGKSSGILLTQTSWLNETLRNKDSLIGVEQ